MGDPSQWTERGIDPGLGPEVHLKIAVQKPTGTPSRFTRVLRVTQVIPCSSTWIHPFKVR